MAKTLVGKISLNPKGFGFVRAATGESYFVAPPDAAKFLSGDDVSFEPAVRRGKTQAENLKLHKRNDALIPGVVSYDKQTGYARLLSDDFNNLTLVVVDAPLVADGVVVAARVSAQPVSAPKSVAVVVERILGNRSAPSFPAEYALAKNNLATRFTPNVLTDAFKAVHDRSAPNMHVSMTDMPFVTIDGEFTKDIDDGVLVVRDTDGGYIVNVAIADVSHYVRQGTEVSVEAESRATSVYLPGRVVPMLPESLSNGVCSLSPNVDRFAMVLTMKVSAQGDVQSSKFQRGIISSRGALTYQGVSRFLDAGVVDSLPVLPSACLDSLRLMQELHVILADKRDGAGRIDLDSPSISFERDEQGRWVKLVEERNIAERCVESLMLLANTTTAKHLADSGQGGIYRVQDAPTKEDWVDFKAILLELYGISVPGDQPSVPVVLQLLSKHSKDSEEYSVILSAFQSRVPRARYSSTPGKHFSLNAEGYAHFTSPIRRLADLTVHRIINDELAGGKAELDRLTERCSTQSSAANFAEHDLQDRAKKGYYLEYIHGDWVPGEDEMPVEKAQVVRSTPKGLRVRLPEHQFTALVNEDELLRTGHRYNAIRERWERKSGMPVVPGCLYDVKYGAFRETATSYELTFKLA